MAAERTTKTINFLFEIALAAATGWLLVLAFPKHNVGVLAWVSLGPLLSVLCRRGPWAGFFLFYICGLVFFLGHFHWILEIKEYTFFHHLLLDLYLGFYFAAFGGLTGLVISRLGVTAGMAAAPFLWVLLEFIRSNFFFLELPWGLLAHSQYRHTAFIQVASLGGVYGVSFLVALLNAALASFALAAFTAFGDRKVCVSSRLKQIRRLVGFGATAAALVGAAFGYGSLKTITPVEGKTITVALVQGNIEQARKWDKSHAGLVMDIFADLTHQAASARPDLIVWPETATPGAITQDHRVGAAVGNLLREVKIPLLIGSSHQGKFERDGAKEMKYQNSVFLLRPTPMPGQKFRYDKIRLFPFGEYLPHKGSLPWRVLNVPDVGGYVAGSDYTVFDIPGGKFSVTICWENLFPGMVRQFVRNGAQFIVNITNEAWFGETEAPEQFLSMNVFRAVENGVYLARCANSGISCVIDPCGRVVDRVRDENGKDVFVRGYLIGEVIPLESGTFYTEHGDWFVWLSLIVSIGFLLASTFKKPLTT